MAKVIIKNVSNTSKLKQQLKQLNRSDVRAGIFEDGEIAMLAHVHEYGIRIKVTDKMRWWFRVNGYPLKKTTTEIVIPERSFLRAGFDANEKKIGDTVERLFNDLINSNVSVDTFLDAVGTSLASYIKLFLRDLDDPPLTKMTIERKKSSNPLIDTGRLRDAIKHEVN